jgi:hypothetical protein
VANCLSNDEKKKVITRFGEEERGGSESVIETQAQAIERAREIDPTASILVERVRNTDMGGRDKWRNFRRNL